MTDANVILVPELKCISETLVPQSKKINKWLKKGLFGKLFCSYFVNVSLCSTTAVTSCYTNSPINNQVGSEVSVWSHGSLAGALTSPNCENAPCSSTLRQIHKRHCGHQWTILRFLLCSSLFCKREKTWSDILSEKTSQRDGGRRSLSKKARKMGRGG